MKTLKIYRTARQQWLLLFSRNDRGGRSGKGYVFGGAVYSARFHMWVYREAA